MEKFNVPKNAAVEYEVTLVNFDKVCFSSFCPTFTIERLIIRRKKPGRWTTQKNLEQSEVLKKRAGELFKVKPSSSASIPHHDQFFQDGTLPRAALKKYTTITEYLQSPKYEDEAIDEKGRRVEINGAIETLLCAT